MPTQASSPNILLIVMWGLILAVATIVQLGVIVGIIINAAPIKSGTFVPTSIVINWSIWLMLVLLLAVPLFNYLLTIILPKIFNFLNLDPGQRRLLTVWLPGLATLLIMSFGLLGKLSGDKYAMSRPLVDDTAWVGVVATILMVGYMSLVNWIGEKLVG